MVDLLDKLKYFDYDGCYWYTIIDEAELMRIMPSWGSYAEKWGYDPKKLTLEIRYYACRFKVEVLDISTPNTHTLEEITLKENPSGFSLFKELFAQLKKGGKQW
jgi:hypothetical protein